MKDIRDLHRIVADGLTGVAVIHVPVLFLFASLFGTDAIAVCVLASSLAVYRSP